MRRFRCFILIVIFILFFTGCMKLPKPGGSLKNYYTEGSQQTVETVKTVDQSETNTVYIVQPGDTLSQIASQYNVDYKKIAQFNQLLPPYTIYVGQQLYLPSYQENVLKLLDPTTSSNLAKTTKTTDCGVEVVQIKSFYYHCWLFDYCWGADYIVKNFSTQPRIVTIKYRWGSYYWTLHKNLRIAPGDVFADTEGEIHGGENRWEIYISDCY